MRIALLLSGRGAGFLVVFLAVEREA